jgi:hypothetical protein
MALNLIKILILFEQFKLLFQIVKLNKADFSLFGLLRSFSNPAYEISEVIYEETHTIVL